MLMTINQLEDQKPLVNIKESKANTRVFQRIHHLGVDYSKMLFSRKKMI